MTPRLYPLQSRSRCSSSYLVKLASLGPPDEQGHAAPALCRAYFTQCSVFPGSLPGSSDGEESACNAGDPGLIPGSGRSPGEGSGSPLQYSCLENPMGRGASWATVRGIAKSRTRLSDQRFDLMTSPVFARVVSYGGPSFLFLPALAVSVCMFSSANYIHIAVDESFLFKANGVPWYLAYYIYPSICLCSNSGCFYLFAFMNNATVNSGVSLLFPPMTSLNDCW